MVETIVAAQKTGKERSSLTSLEFWPLSVRNNPRREMDLPRLVVPMFGPVGSAYVADEYDPAGTAD
ncbi:MAG TPA: hypothetical protein VD902_22865 [Symbiobacteriaceae bacterium]|nr:hypothetical protein [Symbiobacteriaceae bacterium]